jgi:type II secretory pathway pseudopilin PulG
MALPLLRILDEGGCPVNSKGTTLLETMIAMVLVAFAMTGLIVAFVSSGQFGVLSRRQATAMAVARSLAGQLDHAPWADARIQNNNPANDAAFADPDALFAQSALPAGDNAPDSTLPTQAVGAESYEAYVNVAADTNGRLFAVIVRYRVGSKWMRAVALGYHYDPALVGTGPVPLPI